RWRRRRLSSRLRHPGPSLVEEVSERRGGGGERPSPSPKACSARSSAWSAGARRRIRCESGDFALDPNEARLGLAKRKVLAPDRHLDRIAERRVAHDSQTRAADE